MIENITGSCVCSMRKHNSSTYVTTGNSIGFPTFWCGQWRTHQNGGVDANRSMRFRLQGKRLPLKLISVDRALLHQTLSVNRSSTMSDVCERYRYRAVVVPYYTRYLFAPPRKAIHRYSMNISGSKAEGTVACRYVRLHYSVVTKSLFLIKQTKGLYRNFALRKD